MRSSVAGKYMVSLLKEMDIDFSEGKREHRWKVLLAGYAALLFLANDNTDAWRIIDVGDNCQRRQD